MKTIIKYLISITAAMILISCASSVEPSSSSLGSFLEIDLDAWAAKPPVSLEISRYGEESMQATVTDPGVIQEFITALKTITVGKADDRFYTDSDDYLVFRFADGETIQVQFNHENIVKGSLMYSTSGQEKLFQLISDILN